MAKNSSAEAEDEAELRTEHGAEDAREADLGEEQVVGERARHALQHEPQDEQTGQDGQDRDTAPAGRRRGKSVTVVTSAQARPWGR